MSIFLAEMPEGRYSFRIAQEPRFPGRYTLNPVQVLPRYYPLQTGKGRTKQVEIR